MTESLKLSYFSKINSIFRSLLFYIGKKIRENLKATFQTSFFMIKYLLTLKYQITKCHAANPGMIFLLQFNFIIFFTLLY